MRTDFPHKMARGLKREEWNDDCPPFKSAFFFDRNVRKDNKREMSVVDLKFDGALDYIRNQKIGDSILFPAGIAILHGNDIVVMIRTYQYPLGYESRPTRMCEAHGNILVDVTVAFNERKIAARLAEIADFISDGVLTIG